MDADIVEIGDVVTTVTKDVAVYVPDVCSLQEGAVWHNTCNLLQ